MADAIQRREVGRAVSTRKARSETLHRTREAAVPTLHAWPLSARATEVGVVSILAVALVMAVVGAVPRYLLEAVFPAVCAGIIVLVYASVGAFDSRGFKNPATLSRMTVAWTLAAGTGVLALMTSGTVAAWTPASVAGVYAAGLAVLVGYRATTARTLERAGQRGEAREDVAVVVFGDPAEAGRWVELFERRRQPHSVRVRAVCVPGHVLHLRGTVALPTLSALAEDCIQRGVHRVLVVAPRMTGADLMADLQPLRPTAVDVDAVANGYDATLADQPLHALAGVPTVRLFHRPLSNAQAGVKRAEDLAIAVPVAVMLAPLMAAIALAIRLETPGPAIFRQHRRGVNAQPFKIRKFRTMHAEAAAGEVKQAVRCDARVTRVGEWLRKTSLDELPQVFNVLRGEMSIVGPRPHAVEHDDWYGSRIRDYSIRHRMKPGITGWAQVNGLRGETETLDKMRTRVNHDIWYLRNWSLALDLWILVRTLFVMGHRNAY